MKLLVDENFTPSVAKDNWDLRVDTAAVRDRGLLSASDSKVFQLAQAEGRAIVTVNFRQYLLDMARKAKAHGGIIVASSGLSLTGQRAFLRKVALWIVSEFAEGRTTTNRIVTFDLSGKVQSDESTL